MGKRFDFINVNGVKVAFTKPEAIGKKQKGSWTLSLDLEKWK
jgi:hypothetical protein